MPDDDLHVKIPDENDLYCHATLVEKQMVTQSVCKLSFEPTVSLYYHAGQFINIRRPDGTMRSYSLASNPSNDPYLEIYVKRFDNGVMSNWLIDELSINSSIEFHGPLGECYYRNEHSKENILLIGTGTGLSPLQGIVSDAIRSNHQGNIFLYHGCSETVDLYNVGLFKHLQKQ